MLKIAIIGVGTVGSSVAQILEDNKDVITARAGCELIPTIGVVNNLKNDRNVNIKLTDDIDSVLNDESIDIVVELMGGVDDAFKVVKKALQNKKAVVTANKALLAYHRYELQDIAGDVAFEYEAAVARGIQIINALIECVYENHILSI